MPWCAISITYHSTVLLFLSFPGQHTCNRLAKKGQENLFISRETVRNSSGFAEYLRSVR